MRHRRVVALLGPAFAGAMFFFLACGGTPAVPPAVVEPSPPLPPPPVPSASSAPPPATAPSSVPSSLSTSVCPPGQALGSEGNCKLPAPCLDGEEMMGACICPHGKSVDDTGHCVFARCPEGASGGTVFRNETTGECLECRPGTNPCGDHCCPGAQKRSH